MAKKITRKYRVLNYMNKHGGITTYDAIHKLGDTRLSASIWTLRHKDKVNILSKPTVVRDRYGDKVQVHYYYLADNTLQGGVNE